MQQNETVHNQQNDTKNVRKTGGPIGIAWSAIRQMYLCKRGGMSNSSFRG
jgi:hypothetical protein